MTQLIQKVNDSHGFNDAQRQLFALLDGLNIVHQTWEHPPIFTVDEGEALGLHHKIPGQGGKSLLLTSKNDGLWLIVACDATRVDLKRVSDQLGVKRFSFAKPEIMLETMGVTPGSATPFALMKETARSIQVVIDEAFLASTDCVFHPLENRYSTIIRVNGLLAFLEHLGYRPKLMKLA